MDLGCILDRTKHLRNSTVDKSELSRQSVLVKFRHSETRSVDRDAVPKITISGLRNGECGASLFVANGHDSAEAFDLELKKGFISILQADVDARVL